MRIKRKAFKNNRQRASQIDVSKYEWYSPTRPARVLTCACKDALVH